MLSLLFENIIRFIAVFFRTIRAFLTRRITAITSRIRQFTNISRNAAKMAGDSIQAAAGATQTPTKRADYLETRRLLIAKSLLIKIAIILVVLGLFIYFVAWPFILSHFLTARFWEKDSRVENWSGRVIVYADKEKEIPMYAGTLEKGILNGQGKLYDEAGVLSYEGALLNKIPEGKGTGYTNGVLTYEGQYSNGTYDGSGKLYRDGKLLYEGQFSEGKYEGRGTLYTGSGLMSYEGQFSKGVYEGRGTLYERGARAYEGDFSKGEATGNGVAYRNGKKWYEGEFSAGVPEGAGKEYGENGKLRYEGDFSAGLYNGDGILYPAQDQQLEGRFTGGTPSGTVRWSKGGKLYYEGEWKESAPEGFGKLYNPAGQTVFQGMFRGGTLDGAWMLGLTADGLRQALGEEHTASDRENAQSFLITSPELGLTGRCNYQTENKDPEVYSIYISRPEGAEWFQLLPGTGNVAIPVWPADTPQTEGPLQFNPPKGVTAPQGTYDSLMVFEQDKDLRTTLLYQPGDHSVAQLLTWSRLSSLPASERGPEGESDSEKMGKFMDALDKMEGTGGAGLGEENPYFGSDDPAAALKACKTPEDTGLLVDALTAYWLQAERQNGLEDNLGRLDVMQKEEQLAVSMGTGTEGRAEELEKTRLELEEQILACQSARKQAELNAQSFGAEPSKLALDKVLILFDTEGLDVEKITLTAAAWVQANGGKANPATLELEIKSMLVSLEDAYRAATNARSRMEAAIQAVQTAAGGFAMGTVEKTAWYEALNARTDAKLNLYDALATFTKHANALNQKTGGWVSRTYDWYVEEFGFVLPEPEPEPEEEKKDPEGTEAEGAEGGKETGENAGTGASEGTEAPAESPEPTETPAPTETPEGGEEPEPEPESKPKGDDESKIIIIQHNH